MELSAIDRRAIAAERTGRRRAGPARPTGRALAYRPYLHGACRQGLIDANRSLGTERTGKGSRARAPKADEYTGRLECLGDDEFGAIVRLLILTAQRREEIGGRTGRRSPTMRSSCRPTRTKNAQAQTIPPSGPARTIVEALPRRDGREFVFGRGEGGYSGWSRSKARSDERIAERGGHPLTGWTFHHLRRTAVTMMAELGIQPHVIEAVINHISPGTRAASPGIYNKATYSQVKTTALALWAAHVMAIVDRAQE